MDIGTATLIAGVIASIVAQLVTYRTLIFQSHQTREREERLRAWEIEDRAAIAAKVETTRVELAEKVDATTVHLKHTLEGQHAAVTVAIQENTAKTEEATKEAKAAYTEANHVNIKISDLNERLIKQQDEMVAQQRATQQTHDKGAQHLESIDESAADTAETLKSIDEKTKESD